LPLPIMFRRLVPVTARSLSSRAPLLHTTTCAMSTQKYTLPDMPYDYNELEPFISAEIMKLHHTKHHQAYVTNFNAAMEQYAEAQQKRDVPKMIALQPALRFNGGGHINHSIFWQNLANPKKGGGGRPSGALATVIDKEFGSFDKFQTKFSTAAAGVQGSGWGWLGFNKDTGRVELATLPNQDPLTTLVPLLGLDVWEHAYYLQYKNVRPDYLKAIWNVINWTDVARRYDAAVAART